MTQTSFPQIKTAVVGAICIATTGWLGCSRSSDTVPREGQAGGQQASPVPQDIHRQGNNLGSSAAVQPQSPASSTGMASPSPAPSPSTTSLSSAAFPASGPTSGPATSSSLETSAGSQASPLPVVPDRIVRIYATTSSSGAQKFEPQKFEVIAGQQVEIILHNAEAPQSGITHNWVLIKPGTEAAVSALGKQAGVDPDAVTYSPSIMAATRTTRPQDESIIDFVAPDKPGIYPFLSLVGNQRAELRGQMVVKSID